MSTSDNNKTFKDWLSEPEEVVKETSKTDTKQPTNPEVKKDIPEVSKTDTLKEVAVDMKKTAKQSKEQETTFDEFTPPWRTKTIAEMDKKAKSKNTQLNITSWIIAAFLLIGISIGSYVLWESLIDNKVILIDEEPVLPKPSVDDPDKDVVKKEITFYVLEIGVSGSREVATEEIETSCGDVLVPVTKVVAFENTEVGEIELVTSALDQIFVEVGAVYDEENNLVNDIANSGLSVDTVTKVVDRVEVDLAGELETIGVCNTERIYSQIEETAKINAKNTEVLFKYEGSAVEYDKIFD